MATEIIIQMPTYDYVCDSCGHEFEAFESIKSDPQTLCPKCAEKALRRKIGPGAAILFKGSGFYQTDYRSDSYKQSAKADKPPESSSSSTSSEKSSSSSTTPGKGSSGGGSTSSSKDAGS